jgi:hypothetical protein
MSLEYAETRIKEALEQAGNSPKRAQQLLMTWALKDPLLLHVLVKPHLNGIIAYNLDRVASGRSDRARKKAETPISAKKSKPDETPLSFGKELLKAVIADGAVSFGLENGQVGKRKKASENHAETMRRIAKRKPRLDS